jgi:hypothetical protein
MRVIFIGSVTELRIRQKNILILLTRESRAQRVPFETAPFRAAVYNVGDMSLAARLLRVAAMSRICHNLDLDQEGLTGVGYLLRE